MKFRLEKKSRTLILIYFTVWRFNLFRSSSPAALRDFRQSTFHFNIVLSPIRKSTLIQFLMNDRNFNSLHWYVLIYSLHGDFICETLSFFNPSVILSIMSDVMAWKWNETVLRRSWTCAGWSAVRPTAYDHRRHLP